MPQFERLFEPLRLGRLELENRIYMLALSMGYTADFHVNDRLEAFYKERAQGGAGLITVGMAFPSALNNSPHGGGNSDSLGIWSDSFIPGLRQLVSIIHENGPKAVCQIGLQYYWQQDVDAPAEVVGPSAVSTRRGLEPRELSIQEIEQIVGEFADATRRARDAGFDAVEFHGGIGYLINRFLSPLSNCREDEYGGSLEKRVRFLLEIISQARRKAGTDYTYLCRISADEFMRGGNTLEESRKMAVLLERAGIDCLNVQVGWHESATPMLQNFVAPGAFAYASDAIKEVVSIPVATGYRINDPVCAEQILVEGKADLIGMCRALIADPYLPQKAKEGRLDDIRPCIACGHCLDTLMGGAPVVCAVNARVGKEAELQIQAAPRPRNVLVVGGGPAGMEAATVAARRRHKVTLIDGNERLGGQLLAGARLSYKADIARYTRYLIRRLQSAGVEVKLGQRADPASVAESGPEVVVLATGAAPLTGDIPGSDRPNVVTAIQVLKGEKEPGVKVIVVGSGLIGCETAGYLVERGSKVTILEILPRLGENIGRTTRPFLLGKLRQAGVVMEADVKILEITERGVMTRRSGEALFFEADSVVLAMGMRPDTELLEELKAGPYELYPVGDCVEPRRIAHAVAEAAEVAYRI